MRKHQTAMSIYNGHKGESTVKAVWSFVPQELKALKQHTWEEKYQGIEKL